LARSAAAWTSLDEALREENTFALDRVAEQYPHTNVAEWASLAAADLYLNEGCNQLFTNKIAANVNLGRAADDYQSVLEQTGSSLLRERATFGLARTFEAQNNLPKALEKYEQLVKDWSHGVYTAAAQQRIDDLNRRPTKEFYDWFAKFDPKPASLDGAGKGPALDINSLRDHPSSAAPAKAAEKGSPRIKIEGAGGKPAAGSPAGGTFTSTKPAEAKPDSKAPAAAAAKPSAAKPSDAHPAAGEKKPADVKK
jgi:hypothetical protein